MLYFPSPLPPVPQGLLDKLDADLHYAIVHEGKQRVEDMVNYDEVRAAIAEKLESLHTVPNRCGGGGGGLPGGWACQEDTLLDLTHCTASYLAIVLSIKMPDLESH